MNPRTPVAVATLAVATLVSSAALGAASPYCGLASGTCAGGATIAGSVWSHGDGRRCLWECESPGGTLHRCSFGDSTTRCPLLGASSVPDLGDRSDLVTPLVRDGVPVASRYREHNPLILQTVVGEPYRVCRWRVNSEADLLRLGPIGVRLGWWATAPVAGSWATTWQALLDDACYQITPGHSYRPVFLRTSPEFYSYLEWAENRVVSHPPPEVADACLFLFESGTTQRARYAAAAPPPGERTNGLGDLWIDEAPGGGCPCATEAWECGDDMCPEMAAGNTIDGLSCGRPACFTTLTTHWGPDPSTICDGAAYTQTNTCDGSTQIATGTDTSSTCTAPPPPTCVGAWTPDVGTVCGGLSVTQTCVSNSGLTQTATGTDTTSPGCTCTGGWDPTPSTVCDGIAFSQTCLTNAVLTQTAIGTDTASSTCICSGGWTPDPSTVCDDGNTFTQTCLSNSALTQQETGTQTVGCPVQCCPAAQSGCLEGGYRLNSSTVPYFDPWEGLYHYTVCQYPVPPPNCIEGIYSTRYLQCQYFCTLVSSSWENGWDVVNVCDTDTATRIDSYDCSGTAEERRETMPGTLDCSTCTGTWNPAATTVCQGANFTQTCSSNSALTQSAVGTNAGLCPPIPPTCAGTYGPAVWTICQGTSFTQTCSTDSSLTRSRTGTSTSACGVPCTDASISSWSAWSPSRTTVCYGTSFPQTRSRSCTPGTAGTGACTTSCSGVTTQGTQTATGTDPGCFCSAPTACGTWPNCLPCSCAPDCGVYPNCSSCGGCGGGQVDLGCGCGNPAPGSCGCGSQVDLGCGCGAGPPGACGCGSQVDLGCGCGAGPPGPCGCSGGTDLGCGCGNPAPGACGCSGVDLGCGCGAPAPGACGCGSQVDLGCGCGAGPPGPCGCGGGVDQGCGCGAGPPGPCGCSGGTDLGCGCGAPADLGCGCGNPAPGACGCSGVDLGCGCGAPAPGACGCGGQVDRGCGCGAGPPGPCGCGTGPPGPCGCGGGTNLGCGCGNPGPGACGCGDDVNLGCGCGNPAPGACGCSECPDCPRPCGGSYPNCISDAGCGCGNPAPGPCGCGSQVDLGCGCGNPAPNVCGCSGDVNLGCGCGAPAPGACGCGGQVDLGCGCGNPGPQSVCVQFGRRGGCTPTPADLCLVCVRYEDRC